MRITNAMMTSRMLLNIQRNMNYLDNLYVQLASTKRIQVPSDDPILAARTLKFRTSVSETEQYQRNVGQGLSWMSSTDKAFMNVTDIMTTMRTLIDNGATGSNIYDDRASIAANIEQLMAQLGTEMNATYAGRYVFSGFRTDEPPVFEAKNSKEYNITQYFTSNDVEITKSLLKIKDSTYGNTEPAIPDDIKIIKMAYTGTGVPVVTIGGVAQDVVPKTLSEADAYKPGDDEIYFIAQTGELVLGENVFAAIQKDDMAINYDKKGFEAGDLNPIVYFECSPLPKVFTSSNDYSFGITETFNPSDLTGGSLNLLYQSGITDVIVTVGSNTYTATTGTPPPASGEVFYDPATGELTFGSGVQADIAALSPTGSFSVSYVKTGFDVGDINPLSDPNISVTDLNTPLIKNYHMNGQVLEYEFGINTRIGINTLAKDVYTDKMYADLRVFLGFVKSIQISDENELRNKIQAENPSWTPEEVQKKATEQLTQEKQEAEAALYDRFNNMLGMMDKHFRNVSTRETDLGSRMSRLNLIADRLDSDLVNYKQLLSDNEDTNMVTAAIEMSVARAAYEASLQVGARILQTTLADYIR